jgi:hypothetical protein
MIRRLYPDLAQGVHDALVREGRATITDLWLIEHIVDLIDAQLDTRIADLAAVDHEPHDVSSASIVEPAHEKPWE